jgi:hypothetical protein
MKKFIILLILLCPVMTEAQVAISAYAAPNCDDGVGGDCFDIVVDITNVGIGSNDSCFDMDDDGIIDARRLVNSRYSGMDGWFVCYDWDADSLYLAAVAGGSAIKWWDSLYVYGDTTKILYDLMDSTTAVRGAINDSLQANWAAFISDNNDTVTAYRAAINDSLQANWAAFIADNNTQLSEEEVEDFVGGMLGGTETRISVTYEDATNDIDFVVDSEPWDSVTAWGNLVNEAKDSLTSWANEVNAATDSLTSWANKVNAATDDVDELETDSRYLATIYNPNGLWSADSMLVLVDTRSAAAITVTRIDVTCDADPDTELDFDLMWADAFIGNANRVVIDEMNTTNGTTAIASGFDDATVAANKCIYIRFNAEPDADIVQVGVRITYTID